MDVKRLKEFVDFMKENDLVELEFEEAGKKVKLSRGDIARIIPASGQSVPLTQEAQPLKEAHKLKEHLIEIKAPMVGTFYTAPAPNAASFVEIGSAVSPGDVVCIIEAMKLMNEIKSEIKGEVVEILAENGDPVEYGQALFLVKPA